MHRLATFCFVFSIGATAWAQTFPNLSKPPSVGGGENDAALVVAIENYAFLPDVTGAEQNGNDWYLHFTRGLGLDPARVSFLKNSEASKEEIEEAIDKLAAMRKPGGKIWFVFIGHGAPNPAADGSGVLIGVDAQQNAKSLVARGLPQSRILEPLEKATADNPGDAIVLLDACFSGKGGGGDALVPGLQPVVAVPDVSSSVVFLSAARNDEYAGPLPGTARPAYSYLALGALRGWADSNGDSTVSVEELTDYVNDTMKVIVKGRTQTANRSAPSSSIPVGQNATETGPDWIDFVTAKKPKVTGQTSNTFSRTTVGKRKTGHGTAAFVFSLVPAGNLEMKTSRVEVSHNSDTIFTDFELDLETVEDVTQSGFGGQAEVLLGDRGFVGGVVLGFTSIPGETSVRVSTDRDGFSENVTQLISGVDGTVSDVFIVNLRAALGFRIGLGEKLTLTPRIEPGAEIFVMKLNFQVDGLDNNASPAKLKVALPVTVGLGYDVLHNVAISAFGSYFVTPTSQIATGAGVSFYF